MIGNGRIGGLRDTYLKIDISNSGTVEVPENTVDPVKITIPDDAVFLRIFTEGNTFVFFTTSGTMTKAEFDAEETDGNIVIVRGPDDFSRIFGLVGISGHNVFARKKGAQSAKMGYIFEVA